MRIIQSIKARIEIIGQRIYQKGNQLKIMLKRVNVPNTIIDCNEWNLTNLLLGSNRKNIKPVTHPRT
jgi:hypothetical protein